MSGSIDASKSRTKVKSLLDLAGDAVFIHNIEGQILDVNSAVCEKLGYNRDELIQSNIGKLESTTVSLDRRIKDLIKNGKIFYEVTFVGKDGKRILMEVNSTILEFSGKKAILSIARDVSEKRKLEEQFRRNYGNLEKNYRDLINSIDGIVWEADGVDLQFIVFDITNLTKIQELSYPLFCEAHSLS